MRYLRRLALIVVALTLVTAPAAAQNGSAWLTPKNPEPTESAGKVVLTVSMWRAGRVAYQTFDGSCRVSYPPAGGPPNVICSEYAKARAPEDYAASSGELVFTAGGKQTITIPIVDDGVAEGNEEFTMVAWEEVNADPWIPRGSSVTVRIVDDEVDPSAGASAAPAAGTSTNTNSAAPAAGSSTSATVAGGQISGSAVGAPAPTSPKAPAAGGPSNPATTTTTPPPSPDLEVASPEGGVQPEPSIELTRERAPEPAAARGGEAGDSASGFVIGLAIAAFCVGALAVRRRRQWSPTRM